LKRDGHHSFRLKCDGHHSGRGRARVDSLGSKEREESMRGEFINDSEFFNEYLKLNSADQKTFRRWLWANTVVGAILLTGLIALPVKSPGDQSGATAEHAALRTQAKHPQERATILPSREGQKLY